MNINMNDKLNQQSKKIVSKIISYFLLLAILFLASCNETTTVDETTTVEEREAKVKITESTKTYGYTDAAYGQVELSTGFKGSFAIANSTATNSAGVNKVSVNDVGIITVEPDLDSGEYKFDLEVTVISTNENDSSDENAKKLTFPLTLTIDPITITTIDDFSTSRIVIPQEAFFGTGFGGSAVLRFDIPINFADYSIVESNVPDAYRVSVDSKGSVIVPTWIPVGDYSFILRFTGIGNYTGVVDLKIFISVLPLPISFAQDDFSVKVYKDQINTGEAFDYGQVELEQEENGEDITGSFAIVDSTAPNNEISVDANGVIKVAAGLTAGTYTFKVEVTGTGNYTGTKETEELTLVIE